MTALRDFNIEEMKLHELMKEFCKFQGSDSTGLKFEGTQEINEKCNQWEFRLAEIEKERNAWIQISDSFRITENGKLSDSSSKLFFNGKFFVMIIVVGMIIPFVMSSIYCCSKKDDSYEDALQMSKIGFYFILGGMAIILLTIWCSSPFRIFDVCSWVWS